jgi:hypothetical protein
MQAQRDGLIADPQEKMGGKRSGNTARLEIILSHLRFKMTACSLAF